jgi:hypothetical protein
MWKRLQNDPEQLAELEDAKKRVRPKAQMPCRLRVQRANGFLTLACALLLVLLFFARQRRAGSASSVA